MCASFGRWDIATKKRDSKQYIYEQTNILEQDIPTCKQYINYDGTKYMTDLHGRDMG